MGEEYDFSNAVQNPYAKELKKQVTIKDNHAEELHSGDVETRKCNKLMKNQG